jgi:hypothetical protein
MEDKPQDTQAPNECAPTNWRDLRNLKFPRWSCEEANEAKSESLWAKILGFGKRTRYEDYFIAQLRSIYMDLEGDFRTLIPEYSNETDIEKQKSVDEIGLYVVTWIAARVPPTLFPHTQIQLK